jgi:YfiH family protein
MSGVAGEVLIRPGWRAAANVHALSTTRLAGDMARPGAMPPGVPAPPRWLKQVHGVVVADLDRLPADAALPEADAAVATRPGVVCVVRTADCLPVLLAARDGSVVAAAHAGWRGLAAGVIEATVHALRMRAGAAVGLQAWLGPAIGPGHFEVGAEVRAAFLAADAEAEVAFMPAAGEGKWMCDLAALARRRLAALGIDHVTTSNLCTYADEQRFFSHRRDVQHRRLAATGRMASCIWRT